MDLHLCNRQANLVVRQLGNLRRLPPFRKCRDLSKIRVGINAQPKTKQGARRTASAFFGRIPNGIFEGSQRFVAHMMFDAFRIPFCGFLIDSES